MKQILKWLPLFLIFLSSCFNQGNKPQVSENDSIDSVQTNTGFITSKAEIPQIVLDYLAIELPGWTLPDTADYSDAWWSFNDKNKLPYIVSLDLNNDSIYDYAFFAKEANVMHLVALVNTYETTTHWIATDFSDTLTDAGFDFGLEIEPPGQVNSFIDGTDYSFMLNASGIVLKELEFKNQVYYKTEEGFGIFRMR